MAENSQKKRRYLSGAEKRSKKLKKKLDESGVSKEQAKIVSFFKSSDSTHEISSGDIQLHPSSCTAEISPSTFALSISTSTVIPNQPQLPAPEEASLNPDGDLKEISPDIRPPSEDTVALDSDINVLDIQHNISEELNLGEYQEVLGEYQENKVSEMRNDDQFLFTIPKQGSSMSERLTFARFHPIQPKSNLNFILPFNELKVYTKNGEIIKRNWISFSDKTKKLYCYVCMAFSPVSNSVFLEGLNDWNHVYSRINEHENSKNHQDASTVFIMNSNKTHTIDTLFENTRQKYVMKNRLILKRVIDIIKFIGKQGIAFRGTNEGLYNLYDVSVKGKGNFLELVLLLSKYDEVLKAHLDISVEKSKDRKEKFQSKGRGNLITFLSKQTVNQIIITLGNLIRQKIAHEIREAKIFSIEADTTQDVSVSEQCSIVCRYIFNDTVKERLINLVSVESTTAVSLKDMLKTEFSKLNLEMQNIVGCSFDGAANMSGEYGGLRALLKSESPNIIYNWCYAHILNLVVTDAVQVNSVIKTYFGTLNRVSVFLSESYKRMAVWDENSKRNKRLTKICDTRWWSKGLAVQKLLGSEQEEYYEDELYSTLLTVLEKIKTSGKFDSKTISEASAFQNYFCKYDAVLLSFTMSQCFSYLTPASKYLQTYGIDLVQSYNIVMHAKSGIEDLFEKFGDIKSQTDKFISFVNKELEEKGHDIDIENNFRPKRQSRKNKMPGELMDDFVFDDACKRFEVETYKNIINQISRSISDRFANNETHYKNFRLFDPKYFPRKREDLLTFTEAFTTISELLNVDKQDLISELSSFSAIFLEMIKDSSINCQNISDSSRCLGCLSCCYLVLKKMNMHSSAYSNIYVVYKYLLTLSCTQVKCETVFSKLKLIKSRIRSTVAQETLGALVLINVESDITDNIDNDNIINILSMNHVFKNML